MRLRHLSCAVAFASVCLPAVLAESPRLAPSAQEAAIGSAVSLAALAEEPQERENEPAEFELTVR